MKKVSFLLFLFICFVTTHTKDFQEQPSENKPEETTTAEILAQQQEEYDKGWEEWAKKQEEKSRGKNSEY